MALKDKGTLCCFYPIIILSSYTYCFLDPVNIGIDSSNIIPNGNVINAIRDTVLILNCFTTRGHENSVWEIPRNATFSRSVLLISPYQSVLFLDFTSDLIPDNFIESFVCRSSNDQNVNSFVVISISKSTIIIFISIAIGLQGLYNHPRFLDNLLNKYPDIC